MALISVKNIYKIFGPHPKKALALLEKGTTKSDILKHTGCTVAINEANFDIEKGETFVIMGLSGSGKSTMIRCLNRLIEPTKGEIYIDKTDILQMNKEELRSIRRHKMSMVFQHFGLLPHRSVVANVEFGLEVSGVEKNIRREKALQTIELVGLHGFENSKISELSGGMQQRVGLARALANEPEILLMDEAFSALDPLIRAQMQDELIELQAKMHKTIIFITHDLDEALKLGDRIAILGQEGRIRQIGTPEEILSDPADDYIESFIQSVDKTKIITVQAIIRRHPTIIHPKDGPGTALRLMEKNNIDFIFVTDYNRQLQGLITVDEVAELVKKHVKDIHSIIKKDIYTTSKDTAISDLLGTAISSKYPIAVINEDNVYLGVVYKNAIVAELNQNIDEEASPTKLIDLHEAEETVSTRGAERGVI